MRAIAEASRAELRCRPPTCRPAHSRRAFSLFPHRYWQEKAETKPAPPGAAPLVLVPDVSVMSWPTETAVPVLDSEAPALLDEKVIVRIAGDSTVSVPLTSDTGNNEYVVAAPE